MARDRNLMVRMTEEEVEKARMLASQSSMTVSEWVRDAIGWATEMGVVRLSEQFRSTGHWKAVRMKTLQPDTIRNWGITLGFKYTDQDVSEILSNRDYQTKLRQVFAMYVDLKLYYICTREMPDNVKEDAPPVKQAGTRTMSIKTHPADRKEPKGKPRKR